MIKYINETKLKYHRKAYDSVMDQNIEKVVCDNLNIDFIDMILSNPTKESELKKVKIRPITLKGNLVYQAAEYRGKQIFHLNCSKEELLKKLPEWLDNVMKQVQIRTQQKMVTVLISKKGKATIKIKSIKNSLDNAQISSRMTHNREKDYIIKEGKPIPFLIDLGVMTVDGKIIHAKYDKFKQINRFLEFIEDVLPVFDKDRRLTILDFGCGKSYLTFAMYYYLKVEKGYQIRIIGLDLKKSVIENCNILAKRYGYDDLNFLEGDIASYEGVSKVDMVVTLHACDTATDYALYKAICWKADVILSVPCCQHELNAQIDCNDLQPILHYGLIKERIAALATDALRAELLEVVGYKSQILEFIDMEHTPKNILIRAVKRTKQDEKNQEEATNLGNSSEKLKEYKMCKKLLGVEPTLYRLLSEQFPTSFL